MIKDHQSIEVIYICTECKAERTVLVPERKQAVDILMWMEMVMRRVGTDHARKSPLCPERKVDLKIPLSNINPMVGKK